MWSDHKNVTAIAAHTGRVGALIALKTGVLLSAGADGKVV